MSIFKKSKEDEAKDITKEDAKEFLVDRTALKPLADKPVIQNSILPDDELSAKELAERVPLSKGAQEAQAEAGKKKITFTIRVLRECHLNGKQYSAGSTVGEDDPILSSDLTHCLERVAEGEEEDESSAVTVKLRPKAYAAWLAYQGIHNTANPFTGEPQRNLVNGTLPVGAPKRAGETDALGPAGTPGVTMPADPEYLPETEEDKKKRLAAAAKSAK